MEVKLADFKKVVFGKTKKGGKGAKGQTVPPDVEVYNPFGDDGQEEGDDEKEENGEKKERQEKSDKGKKKEKNTGSGGKADKGQAGDGDGEGSGQEGEGAADKGLSREQIEKGAQELLDKLNKANNLPTCPCGSNAKRNDKQKNETPEERDRIEQQAEITRKQIEEIIQKASADGHEHIFGGSKSRGTGGKGENNGPQGDAVPMRMRKPEFLKKIMSFASKEFEKEYYKKGTDWFYTQGYGGNILFKAKPKISIPQKFIYIMVDVSGSMFGNFDGTGKSLLEYLLGYLPVIAEDFKGQVWWISDGLIEFADGSPGITLLSDYKDMSVVKQSQYFKKIQKARGSGGGTTFAVELQAVQDLREGKVPGVVKKALKGNLTKVIGKPEKHTGSIIMLTDSYIDNPQTKYTWNGKTVVGNLPPSTVVMSDTDGCRYIKKEFPNDFKNKELRIECYDVTENGKYKVDKKLNR